MLLRAGVRAPPVGCDQQDGNTGGGIRCSHTSCVPPLRGPGSLTDGCNIATCIHSALTGRYCANFWFRKSDGNLWAVV